MDGQHSRASWSWRLSHYTATRYIPGFIGLRHHTLNTLLWTGVDDGTDPDNAVWQGHWRTHYLPSCLVVQMAIAVLYLLRIFISVDGRRSCTARFDARS
ncbi:hypothetical protein BDU57DRAFT_515136 [Ampelomyces quisqualis]|uniref:Uncharacterized protein n=1 Tax=Ampelomyces quisqualis TaxID=50730 RepID=A0A6A5QV11_AMPQU|nr:hypothetical protein BDU57DRAFT_515136 [Ampelomyces quisqualis]